MVLLLCTNYSTGKEEGCLYLVLLESFTLSSLVCKKDVCYRRKEINYFQILQAHCFGADGFYVFYTFLNIQHILQVLALYYFSTPEVQPRVDRAALLALWCCMHVKRE